MNRNAISASWKEQLKKARRDLKALDSLVSDDDDNDMDPEIIHSMKKRQIKRIEEEAFINTEKELIKEEIAEIKEKELKNQSSSEMEAVEYTGRFLYISTVSSLIIDPIKVKIESGSYTVILHRDGYVFTKNAKLPALEDLVKILNDRDGDPGLSGTYYSGDTEKPGIVKLVYNYFLPYFRGDYWKNFFVNYLYDDEESDDDVSEDEISDDDEQFDVDDKSDVDVYNDDKPDNDDEYEEEFIPLKKIYEYHNIPVLFYLNTQLKSGDLKDLHLAEHHNFGNGFLVWKVSHPSHGELGIAVQQPQFIYMMGDQMGLAVFADMKCAGKLENFAANCFGNIEYCWEEIKDIDDERFELQYTSDYFKALIN